MGYTGQVSAWQVQDLAGVRQATIIWVNGVAVRGIANCDGSMVFDKITWSQPNQFSDSNSYIIKYIYNKQLSHVSAAAAKDF